MTSADASFSPLPKVDSMLCTLGVGDDKHNLKLGVKDCVEVKRNATVPPQPHPDAVRLRTDSESNFGCISDGELSTYMNGSIRG
jgi:hypothetical protein